MYRLGLIFCMAIGLCFCSRMYAQQYPIQAQLVIQPPFGLSLAHYTAVINNPLSLTIWLKDLTMVNYQVRLRLTIESTRVRIYTDPNYLPPPITLQGGVPLTLNGYDLSDYFYPDHLIFEGISRSDYMRTNKLPEGFYRFTLQVLDYRRGSVVSNAAFTQAYIVLNDPPVINRPANNEKIPSGLSLPIVFNWTPRHMGSPNSAFSTQYHLRIVEIWPQGRNPYEAMLTTPPVFETTVSGTTFVYDASYPPLIPGKEYAFNVTAEDVLGRDLFKNGGTSETYRFIYGDPCDPPKNITARPVEGNAIEVSWEAGIGHTSYRVGLRTQGREGWREQESLLTHCRFDNIAPGVLFEYRVQAQCGTFQSDWSAIDTVRSKDMPRRPPPCGPAKPLPPITNRNKIPNLYPGDVFYAGGFEARIHSVMRNEDGSFSGECSVIMPFLNYARVLHTFDHIFVNELYQMYQGKLVSVSDFDPPRKKIGSSTVRPKDAPPRGIRTAAGFLRPDSVITLTGSGIDSVYYANDSLLVVVTDDGRQQAYEVGADKTVLVKDGQGNEYLADKGLVTQLGTQGGEGTSSGTPVKDIDKAIQALNPVSFEVDERNIYGFDGHAYDALKSMYDEFTLNGKSYRIPYKSLESGQVDYVTALVPSKSSDFDPSALSLVRQPGQVTVTVTGVSGNRRQLLLTGGIAGSDERIEARYTLRDTSGKEQTITLGSLSLVSYDRKQIDLKIVPVNGATVPANLAQQINALYRQAVAGFRVEVLPNLEVEDLSGNVSFSNADNAFLSRYTSHMNKVIRTFKRAGNPLDGGTYYLFLIPNPTTDPRQGYMPINGQCGFIFLNNVSAEGVARVAAHELGHGVFRLYHTFSSDNRYVLPEGTTDNLMDYNGGTALYKYQWDYIMFYIKKLNRSGLSLRYS